MNEKTTEAPPNVKQFMPDTVPNVEKNILPPGSPLSIKIIPERLSNVTCCPTATTALATSPIFESPILLVLPCKRWGCEVCRSQKIRALAFNIHAAAPNRLLTLTVDTDIDPNPEVAWLNTRDKPSELFRALRARKLSIEYLKVTEVTKKGYPHYHCLLRSDYLPQPVIKALWTRLTRSSIVDIRIVTNQFNAFSYLVKYPAKSAAWNGPTATSHTPVSSSPSRPRKPTGKTTFQQRSPDESTSTPTRTSLASTTDAS
jgi:hypothetical protein